ncbi:MAG: M23 family metallopeptidase [Patescibacteria group bacterium]
MAGPEGATIGGELTEVVSAPESPKEANLFGSALSAFVPVGASANSGILEDSLFGDSEVSFTGDSLLQNQDPITVTLPEPKPALRPAPYYGPSLPGFLIFPTIGYNQGRLHPYNAVDISRGDDCLHEDIPVFAAASGLATANWAQGLSRYDNGGRGNNISILHSNGIGSKYFHLKKILAKTGDYVNQGAVIAYMGGYPGVYGSGNSTGCHLHFGVSGAAQPFAR